MTTSMYGNMVKAVVDVERGILVVDSMINIRPRQQNMSRGIENDEIKKCIIDLVLLKVTK